MTENKCRCGEQAGTLEHCPFDEDFLEKETICNCCKACRLSCAEDATYD